MTVAWSVFAQSLTERPMKGMLTGPVTILQWSFVRDDLARAEVCRQIALAIRDEVLDLENAGIRVIQIDEPAFAKACRSSAPIGIRIWTGPARAFACLPPGWTTPRKSTPICVTRSSTTSCRPSPRWTPT